MLPNASPLIPRLAWGLLLLPISLCGQTSTIGGTVREGVSVVPGAAVFLRDTTGLGRETQTDVEGKFTFDGLKPGSYDLSVSRLGFETAKRQLVLAREPLVADFDLVLSGVATSVDVTAAAAQLALGLDQPTNAGSRLNLTALDTPASVTTLMGSDIRLRGDATVNSAVSRAAGITATPNVGGAMNGLAARGFGSFPPPVAFLYDGIRNMAGLGNISWPADPWTVERIEVLNGPASVLYGTGGIGGAVNIIPRRPSHGRENTVRLSGGSFNTVKAALDSTGPITDRLLYRFDFSRQQSSGFIDRGSSESTAISGSLAFVKSPKLTFTLMNDYSFIRPMLYFGLPLVNGVARKDLRRQNYTTSDADVHWYENSTRGEINWRPNAAWTIRNVTSIMYADRLWRQGPTQLNYQPATNDMRREGFGLFEQGQVQVNNQVEATLVKPLFRWANALAIGGDVERLDYTRYVTQWPGLFSVVPLFVTDPGRYPTSGNVTTQAQDTFVKRGSIFADDRLKLAPRLSLIAGFRFDKQPVARTDLVTANRTIARRTYNVFNWRAGLVYQLSSSTNVYAQFSRATDAVGNIGVLNAAQLFQNPARGRQFEVGMKQSAWNGRVDWTFSYYQIVKKDLLVPDVFSIATLVQVGSQSSKGVEGTLAVDAGRGLNFGINWTVLNPQYDEFFEAVGGVRTSRRGNQPTAVAASSGNAFTTYQIRKRWLAQASLRYVGERFTNPANAFAIPRYTTVDGGVRWSVSERTAIDFRGVNLFDAFYANNFEANGRGGGGWLLGAPRSFEIVFTARF